MVYPPYSRQRCAPEGRRRLAGGAQPPDFCSLGLENTHAGFTGWGYLTGWNADGQWVEFHPHLSAGSHTLTFRYAAGAGDARRLISINSRNAFPSQRFPGTDSWNNYRTIRVLHRFPAGVSTVSVIYNSSLGSTNDLTLDNLVVN